MPVEAGVVSVAIACACNTCRYVPKSEARYLPGTPFASTLSVTQAQAQASPSEKSSGRAKWIVLAVALLGMAVSAAVYFLRSSPDQPAPEGKVRSVLHLDTFVINLADPEEKAYLRVGIDLGLQQDAKEEGSAPVPLVRDTILGVLAQSKPDELLTPDGKTRLKAGLLQALRQRAPQLGVEDVYFTEFLIQR